MLPRPRIRSVAALLALLSLPALAGAEPRTFQVRADGGSRIQFVSDAPLETITGVTTRVTGSITVDPARLSTARGRASVQTATLRTGNDTRDEHLRADTWLDAARFPNATFELTAVEGAESLTANQPADVRVRGRFTLHGVTKEVVASARVRWMPITDELRQTPGITGDVLRIRASFAVRLTDYGVSVPRIVRLKVANEIGVSVDLRAVVATTTTAAR